MNRNWLPMSLVVGAVLLAAPVMLDAEEIMLELRRQQPGIGESGFVPVVHRERWLGEETAVIVCDTWDLHHCLNAVRRLEEFGPRLNQVLVEARRRGATIIHSPSDCMPAYEGHPARRRALQTPRAADLPKEIEQWCLRIPAEEEGAYPIDQSDGGEDDDPADHAQWAAKLKSLGRNPGTPWKKQSDMIAIDSERDYLTDRGDEVWNILRARGIRHVVLTGVHANMCVLGRPFGLRQLARNGQQVVLMRDMTDSMYNPKRWPYVDHFTGNDLVVSHVERFVCPTTTSDQLLGGRPFRFRHDPRPEGEPIPSDPAPQVDRTAFERHWTVARMPSSWRVMTNRAVEQYRGIAWYRCTLRVPKAWTDAEALELQVGGPSTSHAWLNGQALVASAATGGAFGVTRDALIADDANLLVIRVEHSGGESGWDSAPKIVGGPRPWLLAGRWQFRLGDDPTWSNMPLPARFGTATDIVFEPPSEATASLPIRIRVASGKHAREDCPVSVPIPGLAPGEPIHLVERGPGEEGDGASREIPVQLEPGASPRVWWILSGATPAGAVREFELRAGSGAASVSASKSDSVVVVSDEAKIRVSARGKPVLEYNQAHVEPPAGIDARNGRSAHIHPLRTPSGRIVTDEFPPDHAHQSGVFLAYTKTEFAGRQPNFWDLVGGTGRVRFGKRINTVSGPVFGGWMCEHEHVDQGVSGGRVALQEQWDARVWNVDGAAGLWILDITSTRRCASEEPLRLPTYHYGGMALRGAREWTPAASQFRTSEGKGRDDGNHTRPRWCDLHGQVSGGHAGLAIMTHPSNFRFPEPLRIHPSMPYMVYTPSQLGDWEIAPGESPVSRYRFVAHDGEVTDQRLDAIWQDFADPPMVEIR